MARIKLRLPEKLLASVSIPVRITDINYGNHLGNDSMVSMIHEARVQFLQKFGYSELDVEGTGLILSELVVEYKKESFYGDLLHIDILVGDISSVNFELYYRIKNQNDSLIAQAKTTMVCFDYSAKTVTSIPGKFLSIISV